MRILKKKPEKEVVPSEIDALRKELLDANLPPHADKIAFKEMERLARSSAVSAEYTIGINYIDYMLSLPWNNITADNMDIERAAAILDEEHHGLTEIKERILEHLAVRMLKRSRKHRILVVDDERMTRRNLEHVFVQDGHDVSTAASGSEALALLEGEAFDVVVTDFKMEHVDGMSVLEHAKKKNGDIEVIMISGYASVPVVIDAMKKGSLHFLAKPFKLSDIRETIEKALLKKKTRLEPKGPVLFLCGPPGTGKTSLGQSIARSLERKFIRVSLAGVKDEAELRGHRRSYVGALPGRFIQEIRRAGSRNPVFMLDEIDKIGQDFKGDAASVLLEVLDPEQNSAFVDHYLEVPFDLSQVMFIATANTIDSIPSPLLDRLEVIRLAGYTDEEKLTIASTYLIPRIVSETGLGEAPPVFTDEAVREIIRRYTREAGLRDLQRRIAAICRKRARALLKGEQQEKTQCITPDIIESLLGPAPYHTDTTRSPGKPGIATALAWTESGGEIIFIEATKMKGRHELILTGSLGDVMKESAMAALSYIRSHTGMLNIDEDFFETHDLHIHIPAGAIPKDGPSAGMPIAAALISLLTGRPVSSDVAMSGELTLSGRVLAVGGIREKLMAACRAGIRTVILPASNAANLQNVAMELQQRLTIVVVDELEEMIERIFAPEIGKLP